MTDVANLELSVGTRGPDQAARSLNNLTNSANRAEASAGHLTRATDVLGKAAARTATMFSAIKAAEVIITAQRNFDKLNASLITATGSAGNAAGAFEALKNFAASTPYGLNEVTKAFIQLRNLGLTPSERALTAYGNTASAMGKDLNQMVEAVADAATGEFERLKEFGIKSKVQGDQVAFTFQGVTTSVANNAKAIEEHLIRLGETKFGGGMALQANTLDGAISNLGDTWDSVTRTIAQSGFGETAHAGVLALSGALTDLIAILDALGTHADDSNEQVKEIGVVHKTLRTVFEALTVAGMQVSYVFTTIGADLTVLAAAALTAASGDFKLAGEMWDARKAQAAEDRKLLDARVEKVLWAAAVAEKVASNERERKVREKEDALAGFGVVVKAEEGKSKATDKAAKAMASAYARVSGSVNDRIAQMLLEEQSTEELTAGQKLALGIMEDLRTGTLKLTAAKSAQLAVDLEEMLRLERLSEARKADAKAIREHEEAAKKDTDAAWEKVRALNEQVAQFGLNETAVLRLQAAEYARQLQATELDEAETLRLQNLLAATEAQITAQGKLSALKADKTFWTDMESAAHQTFLSIQSGGKGLWQRLKDTGNNIFFEWLYQQTLKKWIINVSLATSGSGGLMEAAQAATGQGGGGSNVGSLISMGKSIYEGFSTGFASIGSSMGASITALGSQLGSSALSAFGTGMGMTTAQASTAANVIMSNTGNAAAATGVQAGSYVGAAMPWAAGIGAGVMGGRLISGGYSAFGGSGNSAVNAGTAIGALFGSPLGAGIGGVIGGFVNRAFGRKAKEVTGQGVTGTFGEDGFSGGSTYQDWQQKGGWFRSTKRGTDTQAMDSAVSDSLDATYKALKASTTGFAEALGLPTATIEGYTKALKLTLTGDSTKDDQLMLDFFSAMADELATNVLPSVGAFTKAGETAASTLQRLAVDFKTVDDMLGMLGATSQDAFGAVGAASLAMRERLVDLAGGAQALAAQFSTYAQNFLSSAERAAPAVKAVDEALAALGYTGIDTREEFKGLVDQLVASGALATEEGARRYAGLMAVAGAFAETHAAAGGLTEAAASLKAALDDAKMAMLDAAQQAASAAIDKLSASIDAQKASADAAYDATVASINAQAEAQQKAAQAELQRAQEQVSALQTVYNSLTSSLQGVRSMTRDQGMALLAGAQQRAASGGSLADIDGLTEALSVVTNQSSAGFGSMVDFQRAQGRAASAIAELKDTAGKQLDKAKSEVDALNDLLDTIERVRDEQLAAAAAAHDEEISRLDLMLTTAQQQLDALNRVDNTAISIKDALALVAQSLEGLKLAQGQAATVSAPSLTGGTGYASGTASAINSLYSSILKRNADESGLQYWMEKASSGWSLEQIAAEISQSDEYKHMPRFAAGGNFSGGARLVGENGPEWEVTGPSRIFNAKQTQAILGGGNAELSASVDRLATKVERQERYLETIARASKDTADVLRRVSPNGDSLSINTPK